MDIIESLTESPRPRKYWNALKTKLKKEGSELSQEVGQLKMSSSDGRFYKTDVLDTENILRLIQSIPSPKAEPFKLWLARVGKVAKQARKELEKQTGEDIISPKNSRSLRKPDLELIE